MSKIEYCIKCGEPTGNAGRTEDSLYVGHDGPYCISCYVALWPQIDEDAQ